MLNKAEYMRERKKWLKEHHLCVECKKKDLRTLEGFTCCEECAEKARRKYYERKKVKIND